MAEYSQIMFLVLWVLITTTQCATVIDNPVDLEAAEANGKLEIIKQIKKVNDDGSYTIGYEADDGTFKIESRDVLGNIKGTYGYIDDIGEIKRVSYSTSNSSELVATDETPSVVQRIPSKLNRTVASLSMSTTRRPTVIYPSTTISSLTTPSVVQAIPRKRIILSSTRSPSSTTTANYSHFIKDALAASKSSTTVKPSTSIYETSTPARILAQSKPLLRSTSSTINASHKSEGQLLRPEVTLKPTDMPLYRRLPIKTTLLDEVTKPVTEETETIRGNLLRRQLPQEIPNQSFDARQHVANLHQTAGDDMVDVYSASVTTGAPRQLFTTSRSRDILSSAAPILQRATPTIRYSQGYPRSTTTRAPVTEYTQETSTEPSITDSPVPIVQIPANRDHQAQRQQFVELRHPFHRGAILVPVNHLQGRRIPSQQDQNQEYQQIVISPHQEPNRNPYDNQQDDIPFFVRRFPKFRPMPVHVDENGYVRDYPQQHQQQQHHNQIQQQQQQQQQLQQVTPTPFSIPLNHQYISQNDIINEVDQIKPPVTTRDFQKLLQQLIMRQSRLEKISAITDSRRNPYYQNRVPQQYQDFQLQYQRPIDNPNTGPVQFISNIQNSQNKNYEPTQTAQPQQQHPVIVRPNDDQNLYNRDRYSPVTYTPTSTYHPTKRMARLPSQEDDYLPAPVREMLLLRMLQLAINPSLPLDIPDNVESATTPIPRKESIRNVEILGEENEHKRPSRTKRYKEVELDYYD